MGAWGQGVRWEGCVVVWAWPFDIFRADGHTQTAGSRCSPRFAQRSVRQERPTQHFRRPSALPRTAPGRTLPSFGPHAYVLGRTQGTSPLPQKNTHINLPSPFPPTPPFLHCFTVNCCLICLSVTHLSNLYPHLPHMQWPLAVGGLALFPPPPPPPLKLPDCTTARASQSPCHGSSCPATACFPTHTSCSC